MEKRGQRGKKVHDKIVFRDYNPEQLRLPIDVESFIPENHLVRVVSQAIDQMNLEPLFAKYPGGGRPSYHPVMMTKLLMYAYVDRTYSVRRIEKAVQENIMYMWLCCGNYPDFKTINTFRKERLGEIILDVFSEVVGLLHEKGHISLENYFLDGTKIEANANKYSFVWGKSVKRYKGNLRKNCEQLLTNIDILNAREDEEAAERAPIDSSVLAEALDVIDERLASAPKSKELKRARRRIVRDYLPRMKKYESQEQILAERRSYAKTDPDATFMRMKEDHMRNGQLKPGYNVQIGTENQFIVGYSIHQNPGDTVCLQEHLEQTKTILGKLPKNIIADAGYGSEENYEYLTEQQVGNYVKYNSFDREKTRKAKRDPVRVQNWLYDAERDEYICGFGQVLCFIGERKQTSTRGYRSVVRAYESLDCTGCPYRDLCIRQSDNPEFKKRIYINRRLDELKSQARANLESELGVDLRRRRSTEVESAFGNVKGNFGVRRFTLKGLAGVNLEWGLHSIAHNLRKMALLTA